MPNNKIQSLTVNGVTYDIVDNTSGYLKSFTETDPTVPAWAKAVNKPTYTAVEVGALPSSTVIPTVPTTVSSFTNDAGYLTSSDIASVLKYKGTKSSYSALPSSGNVTGDVWHLTDTGAEWAWDGSAWQELGTAIDLSDYLTSSDIATWAKASTKPTYTAAEVGALPDTTIIPSNISELTDDVGFISDASLDDHLGPHVYATDLTSQTILENIFQTTVGIITPNIIMNMSIITFSIILNPRVLLVWLNGTELEMARLYASINTDTNIWTFHLHGRTSICSGTYNSNTGTGDTSWTVTPIATIPTNVSEFTNDSGYLTLSTLPIYNGTVV